MILRRVWVIEHLSTDREDDPWVTVTKTFTLPEALEWVAAERETDAALNTSYIYRVRDSETNAVILL